jgi:outer membrane protein TolC
MTFSFKANIISLVVLLPIWGCTTVGPDFHRPQAQWASTWRETEGYRLEKKLTDHNTWREGFQDSALNRLIDMAYSQNLTLRQTGLRVLEARAVWLGSIDEYDNALVSPPPIRGLGQAGGFALLSGPPSPLF